MSDPVERWRRSLTTRAPAIALATRALLFLVGWSASARWTGCRSTRRSFPPDWRLDPGVALMTTLLVVVRG